MPILRESGATGLASDPVERKNFIRIIGKKKSIMDGPMSDKLQINCFGRFSIRLGCRELDINWRTKKADDFVNII